MHLMPFAIVRAAERDNWTRVEKLGARLCLECGDCSYICPGRVDVSAKVSLAKEKIAAMPMESQEETVMPESEDKEEVSREEE